MSSSLAFTTSEWPTTVSTRESASSASSKKTDRMLGSNEIVDVCRICVDQFGDRVATRLECGGDGSGVQHQRCRQSGVRRELPFNVELISRRALFIQFRTRGGGSGCPYAAFGKVHAAVVKVVRYSPAAAVVADPRQEPDTPAE
jgi:hypothetical protein